MFRDSGSFMSALVICSNPVKFRNAHFLYTRWQRLVFMARLEYIPCTKTHWNTTIFRLYVFSCNNYYLCLLLQIFLGFVLWNIILKILVIRTFILMHFHIKWFKIYLLIYTEFKYNIKIVFEWVKDKRKAQSSNLAP